MVNLQPRMHLTKAVYTIMDNKRWWIWKEESLVWSALIQYKSFFVCMLGLLFSAASCVPPSAHRLSTFFKMLGKIPHTNYDPLLPKCWLFPKQYVYLSSSPILIFSFHIPYPCRMSLQPIAHAIPTPRNLQISPKIVQNTVIPYQINRLWISLCFNLL